MTYFTYDAMHNITIPSGKASLGGLLYVPPNAYGLVLFVHGSGSSRFSVRNQHVARILNEAGLATLLFDLLMPDEDLIDSKTLEFRFDIEFLASRLLEVTKWCSDQPVLAPLAIGYFGASTGGGAALVAAAMKPELVKAVVSRGGRPDLAGDLLHFVKAPTLLIVGGHDDAVIELNENAMSKLNCIKQMAIVPGATHLFEEPGTLDEVARMAKSWLTNYLKAPDV